MIRKIVLKAAMIGLYMHASAAVLAAPTQEVLSISNAPTRSEQLFFHDINQQRTNFNLTNYNSGENIEFTVRKDEIVSHAVIHLLFTPSPALLPILSQLKVYFNDELVQVIAIKADQLGKLNSEDISVDPRYVNDFNRLRIELIGHYQAICENPIHSAIWVEIDQQSTLDLTLQKLQLNNNLAHFPEPFFDSLDSNPLSLPMIFADQPNIELQRTSAILASWFGSKALWRGVSFPALFNQLPTTNAIVFATNSKRPDFLKNYKTVNSPTVEMISHPNNPYIKLLLVLGRDDKDLLHAVLGIAQGNTLFRGQSVQIDKVSILKPRQPYDAPNWIRTDAPVAFSQLMEFDGQLQTKGVSPRPVSLRFNVPPDLFLNQDRGIDFDLKYRYSLPPKASLSELNIGLNASFIRSYKLEPHQREKTYLRNLAESRQKLSVPVIDVGTHNQLSFLFQYGTQVAGGTHNEQCITYNVINNYGLIDGTSTINFSNYSHYIAMPNLNAFVTAGFPFSRMADLSETAVFVTPNPTPEQVTTLLNTVGMISTQTGFPALEMTLTDTWSEVQSKDADVLIIGALPKELRDSDDLNLLLNKAQDWIKEPFNKNSRPSSLHTTSERLAESKTTLDANGSMAAILGMKSPFYKQRSIITLLAESPHEFELLNLALTDKKNQSKIFGSLTIIRDYGINSLHVGRIYHVGYIPWWKSLWFSLQSHPIYLAFASLLSAVLATILLWSGLTSISKRRLKGSQENKR